MSQGPIMSRAYGFNGYVNVFPVPIVLQRDPVNGQDTGLAGQVWVNTVTPSVFVMANPSGAIWVDIAGGGGAFANLTVTPGPTTLTGAFRVNSAGNQVNISTDAVANTTTIGNITGTTAVNINSGTGGVGLVTTDGVFAVATGIGAINIGTDAVAKTITIGNATGATSVVINAGTGAVNLGSNAIAHATTVGSLTGNATTTLQGGTGGLVLTAAATGTINISANTSANTVNVATGNAAKTLTVGSTNVGSTTVVQSGGPLTLLSPAINGVTIFNGTQTAGIYVGTGAPTVGPLVAPQGSLYTNVTAATTTTRLYIATDSMGGWATFTTSA